MGRRLLPLICALSSAAEATWASVTVGLRVCMPSVRRPELALLPADDAEVVHAQRAQA